jgi:hypothetical protein
MKGRHQRTLTHHRDGNSEEVSGSVSIFKISKKFKRSKQKLIMQGSEKLLKDLENHKCKKRKRVRTD